MRPTTRTRQRGFTLAELTVSMAVSVVLVGGLASAIVLASHAIPDRRSPLKATTEGYHAVEQLAGELYCARSFTERSSSAVTFTVADRNGDSSPETIAYAWSTTPGDPLTRQYNGGTSATLLNEISDFQLRYDLLTVTTQEAGPTTETPLYHLAYIEGIAPLPDTGYVISDTTWCGLHFFYDPTRPQGFGPPAPPDATSWVVDEVWFHARVAGKGAGSGITAVQLRAADANGFPTSTVYDEFLLDEGILPSKSWANKGWMGVNSPSFSTTDGACLVFKTTSGTETAQILFQDTTGLPSAAHTTFLASSDAGASWTANENQALTECFIYGTVTSGGTVETTNYLLTSVGLTLRVGPDPSTRLETSVQILNAPEVTE